MNFGVAATIRIAKELVRLINRKLVQVAAGCNELNRVAAGFELERVVAGCSGLNLVATRCNRIKPDVTKKNEDIALGLISAPRQNFMWVQISWEEIWMRIKDSGIQ